MQEVFKEINLPSRSSFLFSPEAIKNNFRGMMNFAVCHSNSRNLLRRKKIKGMRENLNFRTGGKINFDNFAMFMDIERIQSNSLSC